MKIHRAKGPSKTPVTAKILLDTLKYVKTLRIREFATMKKSRIGEGSYIRKSEYASTDINTSLLRDAADKWAEAFEKTLQENNWEIKDISEDLMLGWFANVIEISSDHRRAKLLEEIKKVVDIAKSDGNWNADPYMHGMANGMILIQAIVEGIDPQYLDAPKKWLSQT